jgi:hypothetical protein
MTVIKNFIPLHTHTHTHTHIYICVCVCVWPYGGHRSRSSYSRPVTTYPLPFPSAGMGVQYFLEINAHSIGVRLILSHDYRNKSMYGPSCLYRVTGRTRSNQSVNPISLTVNNTIHLLRSSDRDNIILSFLIVLTTDLWPLCVCVFHLSHHLRTISSACSLRIRCLFLCLV